MDTHENRSEYKPDAARWKVRKSLSIFLIALLCGACLARWDGFTLLTWWRDSHSGLIRWQADISDASDSRNVKKLVALTFDDGPDPYYTPAVLDILQHYHVHATFFVEGRFVRAHPDLARRIVRQGHIIGNHTDTHPYLNRLNAPDVDAEFDRCDQILRDALGLRTYLFRPPRGLWNPTIYQAAETRNDHIILWTVAVEHHDAPTPSAMAARALRLIQPGGILLLHDGGSAPRDSTIAVLPLLLDGLQAQGCECVTLPELLHIQGNEKTN